MKGIEEREKKQQQRKKRKKCKKRKKQRKGQDFEAWESSSCQNSQTIWLYPLGFTSGQGLNFCVPPVHRSS